MSDDPTIHPNLADALGEGDDTSVLDTPALDAIARQLPEAAAQSLTPPPPDLFDRIEAELDDGPAAEATAPVVDLDTRRRRTRRRAALVSAAAILVLVVVGVAVVRQGDDEPTREEIQLAALAGFDDASGTAILEKDGGNRSVRVELGAVSVPEGSHLELWLLDPTVTDLVPLGKITGDGPHELQADVDLATTPIVDISLEPDDGNPAHSGVSVLRGELRPI